MVGDFDQGCFSHVFWMEAGLKSSWRLFVSRWDGSCAATTLSSVVRWTRSSEGQLGQHPFFQCDCSHFEGGGVQVQ